METFSALLAICAENSPVIGEIPTQRPVTRSFDVFFDLRLNKRLSKQSWDWWFETPSNHYDVTVIYFDWMKYCYSQFTLQCLNLAGYFIADTTSSWDGYYEQPLPLKLGTLTKMPNYLWTQPKKLQRVQWRILKTWSTLVYWQKAISLINEILKYINMTLERYAIKFTKDANENIILHHVYNYPFLQHVEFRTRIYTLFLFYTLLYFIFLFFFLRKLDL